MNKQAMQWMAPGLACAAFFMAVPASGASLDAEKLKALSCDTNGASSAEQRAAMDWLNGLAGESSKKGAAPITLGKACVKNVTVMAGPGMLMVQGEICNAQLSEFTDALATVGTKLGKDSKVSFPGIVLSSLGEKRQYLITTGKIDMETGKTLPSSTPYSFQCGLASGNGQ
jgi:hypothetical protein